MSKKNRTLNFAEFSTILGSYHIEQSVNRDPRLPFYSPDFAPINFRVPESEARQLDKVRRIKMHTQKPKNYGSVS